MSEFSVACPRAVFDFGGDDRFDVDGRLCLHADYRSLRSDRVELFPKPTRDRRETCPDVSDVDQVVALACGEHQAADGARSRRLVTDDDEGVGLNAFDPAPVAATSRPLGRVKPLRDDSFEAEFRRTQEQGGPVGVEHLRKSDRIRAVLQQRVEQHATFFKRQH